MRTPTVLLLFLVAVVLAACAPAGATAGAGSLDELVTTWQERSGAAGVVVAVDGPDTDVTYVSGVADRDSGRAVEPSDRFHIGSITKTFVAAAILRLVDTGEVALDDRLDVHVDEPGRFGHVTIAQLLGHTSGVPNYTEGTDIFEHLDRRWTTDELLALTDDHQPAFEAGTSFVYSNSNYLLLGEVLEAVTGRPWHEAVAALVLAPLGLDGVGHLDRTVEGYLDLDNDGHNDDPVADRVAMHDVTGAAGAFVARADELARFARELLDGDLLSDASRQAMQTTNPWSDYGLGLQMTRPDGRTAVRGHGGGVFGFTSSMWWVPELDTSIVVLVNDSSGPNPEDLAELVLRRLVAEPATDSPR